MEDHFTAAGQPSLFKWNIRLQLQDNQAYSNEISGYSCIKTKFTQMEYQVTCIFPTFYQLNFNDWPQSGKCGLCGKVLKKGMGVNGKNTKEKTLNFLQCLYSLFVNERSPHCSPENHVIPKRIISVPASLSNKIITGHLLSWSANYFL